MMGDFGVCLGFFVFGGVEWGFLMCLCVIFGFWICGMGGFFFVCFDMCVLGLFIGRVEYC